MMGRISGWDSDEQLKSVRHRVLRRQNSTITLSL